MIRNIFLRKLKYPQCLLCTMPTKDLDLHEIINRNRIGSKEGLKQLPIELHSLICRACNANERKLKADSKAGRIWLLRANAFLFGIDKVIEALEPYKYLVEEEYKEIYNDFQASNDYADTDSIV